MLQYLPTGQALTIRPLTMADAPALLASYQKAVSETDMLLLTSSESQSIQLAMEEEFIRPFTNSTRHLYLVAEVEDDIIGGVSLKRRSVQKQAHLADLGIFVRKPFQSMGVGRRLMTAMLRWAESNPHIEIITFEVLANNEKAIYLYHHFGFEINGKVPQAIKQVNGDYADILIMSKIIHAKPN
ncbi:RimJ/RimL family protein N-acetyltransferase [Chitinophaga skermanii]|uniref:RimJ/RimL family protein N-acetyltransferase n=1 Tax=Chitinophaga skermanii TaxID=331697 RepID=A0A327QHM4_9BACT|nr:GNAT family N-acetyltransferase [Chitinophaga skermanii]RAJ04116.1 RimJ/RimL family protein N-acetyltransferase [Chitinophaga skermanii]